MIPDHTLLLSLVTLALSFAIAGYSRDTLREARETRSETEDLLNYIQHLQRKEHHDE